MELNTKECVKSGSNTGFGDCVLDVSNVLGAFLVPSDTEFTPADIADFKTTLETAAMADKAERIYPIHGFEQITDNSEDKTIQTLGYGGKYPVKEGDYDWTFQFLKGGLCLLKSLRKFNGSGKSVLFYDANGYVYGQKKGDNLAGIPLVYFWANPLKLNDGSNATVYGVQFVHKPKYINDLVGFVQADFNLSDIVGLQDVLLSEAPGSADPVYKIKAKTGCSGFDLYDLFADDLASVGLWTAVNGTGADLTITSVVKDDATKSWTITIDNTDPDYSPTGIVVLNLDTPQQLALAGIDGYEGIKLTIDNA